MKLGVRNASALAGICLLTLGLKFIFDTPVDYDKLHPAFMTAIRSAVTDSGFTPMVETDFRTVAAFKGECLVWIGVSRAEGGGDAAFTNAYGQLGKISFWYRNQMLADAPTTRALIDRYYERIKTAVGKRPVLHPVYHIISTPGCDTIELQKLHLDGTTVDISS